MTDSNDGKKQVDKDDADDVELAADIAKFQALYEALPSDSASPVVESHIKDTASQHATAPTDYHHDEAELLRESGQFQSLYDRLPSDEFAAVINHKILRTAARHVFWRRFFFLGKVRQGFKLPAAVTAAFLVVAAGGLLLKMPTFVFERFGQSSPIADKTPMATTPEMDRQIADLLERSQESTIKDLTSSEEGSAALDKLIGWAGSPEELSELINKLEKEGKTEEAQLLRELLKRYSSQQPISSQNN